MAVNFLERRLGRNVYVADIISTEDPAVIAEDGYDKEEIQEAIDCVEIQEVVEVGHQTNSSGSI